MIRRPPRSTLSSSSAASDVYKRQRYMVGGVDVWLNTPLRPMEASGTSGMKAAHNGVVNFSVLDGWWIEGWIEGVTGWAMGPQPKESLSEEEARLAELKDLYNNCL